MSSPRIRSIVELMSLPAGDRALRLRWLARRHQHQAAAFTASGSPKGATRRRNRLRKVWAVASLCGVEGIADA